MISVSFRACDDRSTAVEVRDTLFPDEPMRARHQEGWKGTLDRLARLLALPDGLAKKTKPARRKAAFSPRSSSSPMCRALSGCAALSGSSRTTNGSKSFSRISRCWSPPFNPHVGHEKTTTIYLTAYRQHLSLRAASLKLGFVTDEQFDLWVRVIGMTHPLPSR